MPLAQTTQTGTTLVEVLTVLLVISVGIALSLSFFDTPFRAAQQETDAAAVVKEAQEISLAAARYVWEHGNYPSSLSDLLDAKLIKESRITTSPGLIFEFRSDNRYKGDGSPDFPDGYLDVKGVPDERTCQQINKVLGLSSALFYEQQEEATPLLTCSSGVSYNQRTRRCEAPPVCPQGLYSPKAEQCEYQETSVYPAIFQNGHYRCFPGAELKTETCVSTSISTRSPRCAFGHFDPTSHLCVEAPQSTCPDNYTLTGKVCRKTFACVPDFDPEQDHCLPKGPLCYKGVPGYILHYPYKIE